MHIERVVLVAVTKSKIFSGLFVSLNQELFVQKHDFIFCTTCCLCVCCFHGIRLFVYLAPEWIII